MLRVYFLGKCDLNALITSLFRKWKVVTHLVSIGMHACFCSAL